MRATRSVLIPLGLAAAALVGAGLLAELALRLFIRPPQIYSVLLPGMRRTWEADPRFSHGIEGPAHYEVNEEGIRGRPFGADSAEYRILLVGGSTTECSPLDEPETWGAIAARELGHTRDGRAIWVGNVGRSGLTARDHAVTVKYLLRQYPRIDLVVVLVGVNDLTVALRPAGAYTLPKPITDPEAERRQIRSTFMLAPGGFHEPATSTLLFDGSPWYKSTALYQLVKRAWLRHYARSRNLVQDASGSIYSVWREHRRTSPALLPDLPDLTDALVEYRRNLDATVEFAREGGADLVFLTQPTLWKPEITPAEEALLWLGGTGAFQEEPGHAYYAVPALAEGMGQYNRALLEVCAEAGLQCLDLAATIPADTSVFYDDVHFTETGSAAVGHLLASHLRATRPDLFPPQGEPDPAPRR
jgi:hypothetical protein